MSYINHINKYADAQAIQDALDAGTLANPYVAMTSAGTLDWNSLAPTPQVETRIKNTYRITQDDWDNIYSGLPAEERMALASYHNNGVLKVEMEDGTELEYQDGDEYGYFYPVTGVGDYVVYFTLSGDTIWGDENTEGLFANVMTLKSSEIPESINTAGFFAYNYSELESVVLPNHPMTFCVGCFGGTHLSSINNGQNLIPAGSVVESWAFSDNEYLDNITIGSGVTFPETDGFAGQFPESLTAVTFLDPVPPVIYPSVDGEGPGTFRWASIQEIHVPVGYEQAYVDAFNTCLGGEYAFQVAGTGLIEVDPSPSE